jgi:hypothetical protein
MDKELSEKILIKASKMFFRCSTMKLLSLILDYSKTGEIKYIHKALSFASGSLVGYNMFLAEDDFNNKKLSKMLIDSGVDGGLALALRLFMEGERGCALWTLEEFLDEHDTDSKLIAGAQ